MHADNAAVNLAATTQPLPRGSDGVHATLGRSGLVNTTDGLLVSVFVSDQPLALVPHAGFIPLDRFQETL